MDVVKKAILLGMKGDESSRFFHGMLKYRRRKLSSLEIMVYGNWVIDLVGVKHEFFFPFF